MNNTNDLSDEQIAKLKAEINEAISHYQPNNENQKKTSNENSLLEQIITIGITYNLISDSIKSIVQKNCISILNSDNSIDNKTESICKELISIYNLEAAVEEVLEEAYLQETELENDEWDMEL